MADANPNNNQPEKKFKREVSAGIIVYRRTQEGLKFLILYHGHNYWNFPKGKIESEEKSLAAALRETKEETGLSSSDLHLAKDFKAHERFFFRKVGQPYFKVVIFYLAETRNPVVKISKEHQGYAWFLYPEAKKILGRYRDSQRVLNSAHDFLRPVRNKPPHDRPKISKRT